MEGYDCTGIVITADTRILIPTRPIYVTDSAGNLLAFEPLNKN